MNSTYHTYVDKYSNIKRKFPSQELSHPVKILLKVACYLKSELLRHSGQSFILIQLKGDGNWQTLLKDIDMNCSEENELVL